MRLLLLVVLLVLCGPAVPARADDWRWPLDAGPAVSRPFAAPAHRYAAGHRGADLPSAPGAPVLAAGGGVVSYAGLIAGRGVVVVVHGDLRTTYEPVSALVGPGQPVVAGEVLGTLDAGHEGCPVLACLHWGLRRGEDHLDPVRLVVPGPVRLLPLGGPAPVAVPRSGAGAVQASGGAGGGVPAEAAAVGGPAGGGRVGDDGPRVAPSVVRAPTPAVPRPTDGAVAAAAAVALVGTAVAAARSRRG